MTDIEICAAGAKTVAEKMEGGEEERWGWIVSEKVKRGDWALLSRIIERGVIVEAEVFAEPDNCWRGIWG